MVDRDRRRERRTLHEAVERHGKMVYRLALRVLRNRADAEDAAQEVFVKFLETRRRSRIAHPRAWLAITALNTARNIIRRESNLRRREEEWVDRTALEDVGPTYPDRAAVVWEAVDALPSSLRFPLLLHYQEGLKYREIARALECPIGTVSTRIATAKARVKTLLERTGVKS